MIKKADIILAIILIILGLGASYAVFADSTPGDKARITVDNEEYGIYNLSEDQTIEVKQNGHINKIIIKDGKVSMGFSDCANQVCVKAGKISNSSQRIVCLPNKVMVEIISGGEEEYDAVSN